MCKDLHCLSFVIQQLLFVDRFSRLEFNIKSFEIHVFPKVSSFVDRYSSLNSSNITSHVNDNSNNVFYKVLVQCIN